MKKLILSIMCLFIIVACSGADPSPSSGTASSGSPSTGSGPGKVKVSWTAATGTVQGYYIESSTDGASFNLAQNADASSTSAVVAGLNLGRKYYFRVRAFNSGGTGPYTSVVSANL